jgi:hypothetical protein
VTKKNTSESDTRSSRRPTRAAAKSTAQRQPATPASSPRVQSGGAGAAPADTAADMSAAANWNEANPGHDEIAEAAYHRFLRRGGQDGRDFDDWVEAERDLRSR